MVKMVDTPLRTAASGWLRIKREDQANNNNPHLRVRVPFSQQKIFMIELKYDIPVKVNRIEYDYLMENFCYCVAGHIDKRFQCYVKLWLIQYKKPVEKYLNRNKK